MRSLLIAAFLLPLTSPTLAANRTLSVTSFDRIRIDGGYKVTLATGVSPSASVSGSPAAMDAVSVEVEGRTLIVRRNPSVWSADPTAGRGPVEISVGTPDLAAAYVNGSGSLAIDRISGLSFDLAVQGAGSVTVDQVKIDQFRVAIAGAASARLTGDASKLTAIVRGTSSLDGTALQTRDATVGAEGPAIVKLQITNSAKIDAHGTASVSITGNPACTVKTEGSATVEGCR